MTDAEQPAPLPGAIPPPPPAAPVPPPPAPSPYVSGYAAPSGAPPYGGQPGAPAHGAPAAPAHGQPGTPSYAQPGAPVYAQPGVPVYAQPGVPVHAQPGPYPAKPATGAASWALGFVLFVPIPFLNVLLSGIAMVIPFKSAARQNPLALANARSAANWALTMMTVSTSLLLLHFVILFVATQGAGVKGFYPLGIPITLYAAVVLLHLVLVIVGTVRASSGKEMKVPFAIPYLRR